MKNLVFLFLATFLAIAANAQTLNFQSRESESIRITRDKPRPIRTRSANIDPVTACLNFEIGQVEVEFDEPEGNATIYILDSQGMAIGSCACNTEMDWYVCLPIPAYEGYYTLKIITSEAEYIGYFML
jgi:hypothetical protein